MPQILFFVPSVGQQVKRGLGSPAFVSRNLARVQAAGGVLDFMIDDKKTTGPAALFNKRSSLPSAKIIAAFNKARQPGWFVKKQKDMRTREELAFNKAGNTGMRRLKMSRNHKIPDSLLGSMIQRTVISSILDSRKTAKAAKARLTKFASRVLAPLESSLRQKKLKEFNDRIGKLTSGPLSRAKYQEHFKAAKRVISGNPANLRLGNMRINSALSDSLDPNGRGPGRPSTPVSEDAMDALDEFMAGSSVVITDFLASAGGASRTATSSYTPL